MIKRLLNKDFDCAIIASKSGARIQVDSKVIVSLDGNIIRLEVHNMDNPFDPEGDPMDMELYILLPMITEIQYFRNSKIIKLQKIV